MDLSQLSDEELEAAASAPDLGNVSDAELEKIAGSDVPQQSFTEKAADYAASAIPVATSVAGSAAGSMLGPLGTVGGGAAGYAAGNQVEKYIRDKFMGQPQAPTTPSEVGWDLAKGSVGGLGGLAAKGAMKMAPKMAERFATSPIPGKIADAISPSTYLGGGGIGRAAGYMTPLINKAQAVGDTLKFGVGGAQKGVAWALDHAPEALGKFSTTLQEAAARGGSAAVSMTDFLLTQRSPEFQEIKKKMHQ